MASDDVIDLPLEFAQVDRLSRNAAATRRLMSGRLSTTMRISSILNSVSKEPSGGSPCRKELRGSTKERPNNNIAGTMQNDSITLFFRSLTPMHV